MKAHIDSKTVLQGNDITDLTNSQYIQENNWYNKELESNLFFITLASVLCIVYYIWFYTNSEQDNRENQTFETIIAAVTIGTIQYFIYDFICNIGSNDTDSTSEIAKYEPTIIGDN